MSSLIRDGSSFKLSPEKLATSVQAIAAQLQNRVQKAYIFGSASTGKFTENSDIDMILIVSKATKPFVQRGFDFIDLFEIYPKIDLLVYTQAEFDAQLADSHLGFWKSARESLKQIV